MEFRPTKDCKKFPDTWRGLRPEMPCSYISNEEVDQAIEHILAKGASHNDIPTSQYGRRVAVMTYLQLEAGQPITYGVSVPTPYKAGQPR